MKSSREKIIVAALRLADEIGLSKMNIRVVADAAGYSPSLVIRLFHSRAGLVGEMFTRSQVDLKVLASKAAEGPGDPAARCMRVFERVLEFDLERIEMRREVMANAWSLDPKARLAAEREAEQLLPVFTDIVSEIEGLATVKSRLDFAECLWEMYLAELKKRLFPGVDKAVVLEELRARTHMLFAAMARLADEPGDEGASGS